MFFEVAVSYLVGYDFDWEISNSYSSFKVFGISLVLSIYVEALWSVASNWLCFSERMRDSREV